MHKKASDEKAKKQELAETLKRLKIRKVLSGRSSKYYAIQHPTDLVITNSWSAACDIIAELEKDGSKCRYKGFTSIKQAEEFLRKVD